MRLKRVFCLLYNYNYIAQGYKSTTIVSLLKEEGLVVTASSVCRLLKKYKERGTIARHPGSGRPTKITSEVLQMMEAQMQRDDKTTAVQLQKIMVDSGHPLCLQTILNSSRKLGWTFRDSAYCQLIRNVNKVCVRACVRTCCVSVCGSPTIPVHCTCMYMHYQSLHPGQTS